MHRTRTLGTLLVGAVVVWLSAGLAISQEDKKPNPTREKQARKKFSEGLLKWYPEISGDLAAGDVQKKFEILQKITEMDGTHDKPQHSVTEDDIAGVIGEVLSDGGKSVSKDIKMVMCAVSTGGWTSLYGQSNGGWYQKVHGAGPHIKKLLDDQDAEVRGTVIKALVKLEAKEAIPDIRKRLKDVEAGVRISAVLALGKLGAKEAAPDIMEMLKDKNVRGDTQQKIVLCVHAISVLGILGAKEAIPDIREMLQHGDFHIRHQAILALVDLRAMEAVPDIKKLLSNNDAFDRGLAGMALVELGEKDSVPKEVIKDIKMVRTWGGEWATRSAAALRQLGVSEEEIEKAKK